MEKVSLIYFDENGHYREEERSIEEPIPNYMYFIIIQI